MGLFSPEKYASATDTLYNNNYNFYSRTDESGNALGATEIRTRVGNLSGTANKYQVIYNNAKNVADLIKEVVKPTVTTMEAHDHIYLKNGLKINDELTDAYYTTNELWKADSWDVATNRWTRLTDEQFINDPEAGTTVLISNLVSEIWVKLRLGVTDTGRFLTSANATYNERTGKWEKDPNDGPVVVGMKKSDGEKIVAEDKASTTVDWSFEAFKITGTVISGKGDFVINGFETNELSVAKGYNPEAMFKGAPGWAVSYIEVDGQVIDKSHYITNWYFGQISADHDIKVAFTNIVAETPPPEVGPTVYTYDGEGHTIETLTPPTFVEGYEEYSNKWYMVYSLDPDADPADRSAWSTEPPVTNVNYDTEGNVIPTTVYARVCLEQPGYENGAIGPDWLGESTVTILPREITIKYDDYVQTGSNANTNRFNYTVVDGELVPGDYFTVEPNQAGSGVCTNVPTAKGTKTEDSITKTDNLDIVSYDGTVGNYIINVEPGDYYRPDLDLVATAPDITEVYDGNLYGTHVTVTFPEEVKTTELHQVGTPTTTKTATDKDFGTKQSSFWRSYYYHDYNGQRYYYVVSNETQTVTTKVETILTIEYSVDGGTTWVVEEPAFKDVGEYEVMYRVNYTSNVVTETTRHMELKGTTSNSSDQNNKKVYYSNDITTVETNSIQYTEYVDSANVTILKRDLVVTAGSSEKTYDGRPLVNGTYTAEGFADNEGFQTVNMTSGSTITDVGGTANVIDPNRSVLKPNTDLNNYNVKYVDGTLKIVDISHGGGSEDFLDESKALMIIDHEACADGWVYLAFDPQFMTTEGVSIDVWARRTDANKGFKFKYGRTREDCEACNPVAVELSLTDEHAADIRNGKIWVKVPLKNIQNIATLTEDLVLNTGYIRLFIAGKADEWKYKYAEPQPAIISGGGATSINRFGILRYDSTTTNTMIAIPWTWYSESMETAGDIPTRKLVKETNLSDGDTLLQFTQTGTYAAWYMFDNKWQTIETIRVDGFKDIDIDDPKQPSGKMTILADDESVPLTNQLAIARGRALWLTRQDPTKPFYTYGQDTVLDVETVIEAPTNFTKNVSKDVISNAIGNPFVREIKINDLEFEGEICANDRIWVPNGTKTALYLIYTSKKGGWVYASMDPGTRRTYYVSDIPVNPGLGFWYDRRGDTPMKIKWPR